MTLRHHRLLYPGKPSLLTLLETAEIQLRYAQHYRKYGYVELASANTLAYENTLREIIGS